MPTFVPIPLYISYGKITQYLSARDINSDLAFKDGPLNINYSRLVYLVRKPLEWAYNMNPNNPALEPVAIYLYQLCGKYVAQAQQILNNLTQSPPVVSGPTNESATVGNSATFTISVTSSLPYTIAWFLNGVLIPGETGLTYTKTNAQLSDSGDVYTATVTNAAGSTTSNPGILTVTTAIQANFWFGPTDPFPALSSGSDTLAYQVTQNITHNAAITINYPAGAENNQFNVLRYPNTENDKTTWFNSVVNNGVVGDSIMRDILNINGSKYIISRVAMSLDNTTTTLTYT